MIKRKKIWIAEPQQFSSEAKQLLEEYFDLHIEKIEQSDLNNVLNQCDVLYIGLGHKITSEIIPENPRCKFLICPVTGINHIDVNALQLRNIKLISLKGEIGFLENIHATSEHTFALILALYRNIASAFQSVKRGEWNRDQFIGHELYQKTIGILGFGRLGKQTAKIAHGFGMHVMIHEINTQKLVKYDSYCHFVELDRLLAKCDILTIHIDLTEKNIGLIDLDFLKKMKSTAILINTSRGEIINERDLIFALKNNIIHGAAVDVLCNEPNPDLNNEIQELLREEKKLIITPHIGGNTIESRVRTDLFVFEKLIKELQLV